MLNSTPMKERYYTQFANAAYILPVDEEERKRLADLPFLDP